MLTQNYLKVFVNGSGTVTIASGHGEPEDFQTLEIETITVSCDDLIILAEALQLIAQEIDEESNND